MVYDAAPFEPVGGPWADDVVELRVIRVLDVGDLSHRTAETAFLADAPEIRFSIHLRETGERVGRIHIRVTDLPEIVDRLGHAGYAVDEGHRRRGYATRAVRLLLDVARTHAMNEVVILIEPDNVASRRTVERVGFAEGPRVHLGDQAEGLGLQSELCRYAHALRPDSEALHPLRPGAGSPG